MTKPEPSLSKPPNCPKDRHHLKTSRSLLQQADQEHRRLAGLSGAAFDKAYAQNEVAYHKTVNGALQSTLIPSAQNTELKSLLQTGLQIFEGHQQHAEQLAIALK